MYFRDHTDGHSILHCQYYPQRTSMVHIYGVDAKQKYARTEKETERKKKKKNAIRIKCKNKINYSKERKKMLLYFYFQGDGVVYVCKCDMACNFSSIAYTFEL